MKPKIASLIFLIVAFIVVSALISLCAGCASAKPRMTVPIHNPDLAPVKTPVERAQRATTAAVEKVTVAQAAIQRSALLVESLPVTAERDQLKLELATAAASLSLTSDRLATVQEALAEALDRVAALQLEVNRLHAAAEGYREEARINGEQRDQEKAKREAAQVAASRNGRERDVLIIGLAILGAVAAYVFVGDRTIQIQPFWIGALITVLVIFTGFALTFWLGRVIATTFAGFIA